MADSESILEILPEAEGSHPLAGGGSTTSFSQLLFSNDDDVVLDMGNPFHFSSSIDEKPPKMLCFGGNSQNGTEILLLSDEAGTKITSQVSGGVTCSNSSSASSGNNINNCNSVNVIATVSQSNRKRNGSSQELPGTPLLNRRTSKRTKPENPTSTGNAKVRREKLGDRITALQQLVSPFGKTDTTSVLHEAMGYIRFLHEQVQVLCSPYLQHLPEGGESGGEESIKNDLRRRGLCLVPVDCTVHVASSNGADYWSPATMGNNLPSFSGNSESVPF